MEFELEYVAGMTGRKKMNRCSLHRATDEESMSIACDDFISP